MKENSHSQGTLGVHIHVSDPNLPGWSLSAGPGQLVCVGLGQDCRHFKDLRSQVDSQLRLQQSIFEEDPGKYWHFRLLNAQPVQSEKLKIEGMGFVRLVALGGVYNKIAGKPFVGFGQESLGRLIGLDCLLSPIISKMSIPLCPKCQTRTCRSGTANVVDFLTKSKSGELLIIAGQVRVATESSLTLGQLIEMTEVERVVIGDRLFSYDQIGADVEFSHADRVGDFGVKLPNLLVVLDSLSLSSASERWGQVGPLVLNAERRWGKPIWLLEASRISSPRELAESCLGSTCSSGHSKGGLRGIIASSGFVCPSCEVFIKPMASEALELQGSELRCKQCEGVGCLLNEQECPACLGTGLVWEWARSTFLGIELHNLRQLTLAGLKCKLETSEALLDTQRVISSLKVLDSLGFGDYKLGDNYMRFSLGERVRWAIFEQIVCDLSGSTLIFQHSLDIFERGEVEKLIDVVRGLAGRDNCGLVMTMRHDIASQCDLARDIKELDFTGITHVDSGRTQGLELVNVHLGQWLAEKLTLPIGGLICVAGPSGSGKTTLLRDILSDVFKRGGPNSSIVLSSSSVKPKEFGHYEYLDLFSNQNRIAFGPLDTLASLSGLDLLLAEHFCQTKDARLNGFLARDFLLRQSRHKCKKCQGLGVVVDGAFTGTSDDCHAGSLVECGLCRGLRFEKCILEIKWNDLEYGRLISGSWAEAEQHSFGDFDISKTCQNFVYFGFGSTGPGVSCADFDQADKIRSWFAASFSRHGVNYNDRPGAIFALDYPFIGLNGSDAASVLTLMRELTSFGHTIYCVDNNPMLSHCFDQTIKLSTFVSKDGSRHSKVETP